MDDTNNNGTTPVTVDQALDQIQNWINTGNTQMAGEGLKEVLEMDPLNQRALNLQNQMTGSMASQPLNDDIQIGGLQNDTAPTMQSPVSSPETSTPAPGTGINLGDLDSMPTMTSPSDVSFGATDAGTMPTTPDSAIPSETPSFSSEPSSFSVPTTETVPENGPTFEQPAAPEAPMEAPLSFTEEVPAPAAPLSFTEETPSMETPAMNTTAETPVETTQESPFASTEKVTPTESSVPTETPMAIPALNAVDKKAILMKSLIPLAIALVLGFVVYFSYGYFSDDGKTNTDNTPTTNDIVTQPETTSGTDSSSQDSTTNTDTSTSDSSSTSETTNGILKPEDTSSDTFDTGTKSSTDTETKVKVKRPVKKVE